MKKTFFVLLLALAQLSSFSLMADETQNGDKKKAKEEKTQDETDISGNEDDLLIEIEDDLGLESDFRFEYDGEINTNILGGTEGSDSVNFDESFVSLSAVWKNKIRGVLTFELQEFFKDNKIKFNNDFDVQKFVKEAFVEIRHDVAGKPMAFIVGKQPIPFGQNVQAMPIFNSNPAANLQEIDEVYGFTVELTDGLMFDRLTRLEIAAFETEDGDLELGKVDGVSVRMDIDLSAYDEDGNPTGATWLMTLSHAEMGNSHLDSGHERRTSVGLIGETQDGSLVGWVETILFSNNPEYPNSKLAITAGGMMRVSDTTDVIVEYTFVEKEVHQFAVGMRTALTANLTFGAEIRYNNYVNDRPDEVVFGINLTYAFGSHGEPLNHHYLLDFDKDEEK